MQGKVCGDIANDIHFGVNTCEGCKKFFRRGLVENQSYICKGEKECGINPRNRNNCRYCRYQKCLTVGMSREAIKMGRPKKGDGSEASCNLTSSPKLTCQPLVDLENNHLTNPQVGDESCDTLKTSSAREKVKEEDLRSSCHFDKKLGEGCNQGQQSTSPWQPCSQGRIVSANNHSQNCNGVTEFIEEEMDEILMMLQNDNQPPTKKLRCDRYAGEEIHRSCKVEFGMQNEEWLMNGMSGQSMNEPMNMSATHANQMISRPPPQYPGYTNNLSPCHSPKNQVSSPRYMPDTGVHSPGYIPNGSPASSPSCQYSPRHSPMYLHPPSPHSPYQEDRCPQGSPYSETVYQSEPYSPQDSYQVTDLSVNCGLQTVTACGSPVHSSPVYTNQMAQLSNPSPAMTIPHQEGGVNSHDGWCLTGSPSFFCDSPLHNSVHTTIPSQEGKSIRSSSRLANLQKINHYFMSQSPCDLQLSADNDRDGTMTRSDIEEEIVHKTLASVSPAQSFYYVLSENNSYSSDSNCSTNYDKFTSCQRVNKRKSCDSCDMNDLASLTGSNVGRYNESLSRKYWQQIPRDRTDIQPITSDKQALLDHLNKIFEQMLERCSESTKNIAQENHNWQQIQLRIIRNTSAAVKFASQIPGFSNLHPEDKAFLCKSVTFMSTVLMAGQHLYSPSDKNFHDFWNWQITPQNPFFPFKERLLEVGEKIHSANMDLYEVSVMAALIFLASDFLDLAYPEAIEEARAKVIGALKSYEMSKGVDVHSRLTHLFSLIPEIRHVGIWHQQLMKQMKISVQKQEVQQLFEAVNYRES
ncbi:uncharacterized protein LOC123536177 isoform X2 [Mercenaria mercenaria]|uniref:uncharacterized protein LOC123536177 isoform X2 n=1 Tax=Mercenaria mercenaria TaxID=6596 RepID=UPI00234F357A|nr:uncharacterized protein LOC123536177 isoform X2 [Mercenaria mercenaria]